jgi:hypothetical protein
MYSIMANEGLHQENLAARTAIYVGIRVSSKNALLTFFYLICNLNVLY